LFIIKLLIVNICLLQPALKSTAPGLLINAVPRWMSGLKPSFVQEFSQPWFQSTSLVRAGMDSNPILT